MFLSMIKSKFTVKTERHSEFPDNITRQQNLGGFKLKKKQFENIRRQCYPSIKNAS